MRLKPLQPRVVCKHLRARFQASLSTLFIPILFPGRVAEVLFPGALCVLKGPWAEQAWEKQISVSLVVLQLPLLMQMLLLLLLLPTLKPPQKYRAWRTLFPRTAWTTVSWKTPPRRRTKGSRRLNTMLTAKGKERRVEGVQGWVALWKEGWGGSCSLGSVTAYLAARSRKVLAVPFVFSVQF